MDGHRLRRAILLAIGLTATSSPVFVRPAAAEESAPILLFYAPDHGGPVPAARQALEELATRRATVVVDLSPREPAPPQTATRLRRGIEAYRDFHYQAARDQLDAGVAEATASGARGLTPSELSDLLLYRALVYGQLGDDARAWDDFVRAATVDPTRTLDPVRFSPHVIQTLERAVAAVTPNRASLRVAVAPACAVWVDARAVSPGTALPVIRGEHYVRVECPDAIPYASRLVVDAEGQELTPRLTQLVAPSDAELVAEARRRGAQSAIAVEVSTGPPGQTTATLRRLAIPSGKELGRTVVALSGDDVGAATAGAANRMIDFAAPPPVRPRPRRHWYHNRWLWAAAGAAVTAAALLPLAVNPGPATGFDISVDYQK